MINPFETFFIQLLVKNTSLIVSTDHYNRNNNNNFACNMEFIAFSPHGIYYIISVVDWLEQLDNPKQNRCHRPHHNRCYTHLQLPFGSDNSPNKFENESKALRISASIFKPEEIRCNNISCFVSTSRPHRE